MLAGIGYVIYGFVSRALERSRAAQQARDEQLAAAARQREQFAPFYARCPEATHPALAEAVGDLVRRVNEAWVAGSMVPVRAALSDGVFVCFQVQLALGRAEGQRNVMGDWKLHDARVVGGDAGEAWDVVHVRITASARDTDVPLQATPEEVRQALAAVPPGEYQEIWSLLRRGSVAPDAPPALSGTRCPKCGATFEVSERVRCQFCGELINSGEHGWVLAEITQASEWSPRAEPAGLLGPLRKKDPLISRQELEDRASVFFWKWIQARVSGNLAGLERYATPGVPPIAPAEQLSRVAVGSAELESTERRGGKFRATVVLTWSARLHGRQLRGGQVSIVMHRSDQAAGNRGLSSLDCPACRGPVGESDDATCRFCQAPLRATEDDWSLFDARETKPLKK